ncbi:SDR family NAD(P)-dependent oxidoreductase [Streptomyces atratus]|uniref:SDR family NAD(P)-dependent oxidoreductase n=1 Tax=Streptomyces atratus TaxID=1893 RepID=UPI0033F91BEF
MTSRNPAPLDGQWIVVTGGSKGIGFGIASEVLAQGANVVVVARDRGALDTAREQLSATASEGQRVEALTADISDEGDVDRLFTELRERVPELTAVVANAGTGGLAGFLDLDVDEWDRIMRVNLRGTFLVTRAAARLMIDRPRPNQSLLVVSSIRAQQYRPGTLPYSCTKAGLNQFVRGVALELAPHRIRVNGVSPGMTVTPLMLAGTPDVERIAAENIPFGRAGQPVDTARAAAFLCGPGAEFITGANLVVDGGESLR